MSTGDPIADDLAASFQRGAAQASAACRTAATIIATLTFKSSGSTATSFGPRLGKSGRGHRPIEASTSTPQPFEPVEIEVQGVAPRTPISKEEKKRRKARRKAAKKSKRRNRR